MTNCMACGEPDKGPVCFACQLDAAYPDDADWSDVDDGYPQEDDDCF